MKKGNEKWKLKCDLKNGNEKWKLNNEHRTVQMYFKQVVIYLSKTRSMQDPDKQRQDVFKE